MFVTLQIAQTHRTPNFATLRVVHKPTSQISRVIFAKRKPHESARTKARSFIRDLFCRMDKPHNGLRVNIPLKSHAFVQWKQNRFGIAQFFIA